MVNVVKHPLIDHKMALIRDKHTPTKVFRDNVSEISGLLTFEITKNLETKKVVIETPLASIEVNVLNRPIVIVPILRAGLGMVDGISNIIPTAKIGHIGMYRDEFSLTPVTYYAKLPKEIKDGVSLVVDPMLATGGSASACISLLKQKGAYKIIFVGLVGCEVGIKKLLTEHPDVEIFLASIDDYLNEKGYIVPGLGDCGDRLFGTK